MKKVALYLAYASVLRRMKEENGHDRIIEIILGRMEKLWEHMDSKQRAQVRKQ